MVKKIKVDNLIYIDEALHEDGVSTSKLPSKIKYEITKRSYDAYRKN